MQNNLIFTGLLTLSRELSNGVSEYSGKPYFYKDIVLTSDEVSPQILILRLSSSLAQSFHQLNVPLMHEITAHLRVHGFEYTDKDNEVKGGNNINCWKLEFVHPQTGEMITLRKNELWG